MSVSVVSVCVCVSVSLSVSVSVSVCVEVGEGGVFFGNPLVWSSVWRGGACGSMHWL